MFKLIDEINIGMIGAHQYLNIEICVNRLHNIIFHFNKNGTVVK